MWLFAYGSLMYKMDFKYLDKIVGRIKGYSRRLYQIDVSSRGTVDYPGRVLTLIPDKNGEVWGIAYQFDEDNAARIIKTLDNSSQDGYQMTKLIFHPAKRNPKKLCSSSESSSIEVVTFIGTSNSFLYSYEPDLDVIAKQISTARGTRGKNSDYLISIIQILKQLKIPEEYEDHIFTIAKKISVILKQKKCTVGKSEEISGKSSEAPVEK